MARLRIQDIPLALLKRNPELAKELGLTNQHTSLSAQRESELHSQIISICKQLGFIYLHGAMHERTRRTLGEPDFIILLPQGKTLMVECKSIKGKLSLHQRSLIALANKLGHKIHIVRDITEFKTILGSYGITIS